MGGILKSDGSEGQGSVGVLPGQPYRAILWPLWLFPVLGFPGHRGSVHPQTGPQEAPVQTVH